MEEPLLLGREECLVAYTVSSFFSCCISSVLSEKQVQEARIIFTQGCESDWDCSAVSGQERASSSRLALTKGIVCTTLFLLSASRSIVLFRYCIAFEVIGRF